jgi:hypothetical protein
LKAATASAKRPGLDLPDHGLVLGGLGQHRHVAKVLGRRTQHGRAANVDLLDGFTQRAIRPRHGGLERVQVQRQQSDRRDAVGGHHRIVLAAPAEQAAVDARVQGLDPPVHDFRETGHLGHLLHGEPGLAQGAAGAAGGNEFDTQRGQTTGEIHHAGLVRHAEQGAAYRMSHDRTCEKCGVRIADPGTGPGRPFTGRIAEVSCAACCG